MELKDVLDLGVAGIALIVCFILALLLWNQLRKTNSVNCLSPMDTPADDAVGKAHSRIDEFQRDCQKRHEGLGTEMSTMLATITETATDVKWIKQELQKNGKG